MLADRARPAVGRAHRVRRVRLSTWINDSRNLRTMGLMPERLIITADDYGYAPGYDAGITEAAAAGAIDAVSAMVGEGRSPDPAALAAGVAVGLHLELPQEWPPERERRRAAVEASLGEHWARFESIFGRPPAHLDGHLHCHAQPQVAVPVARFAREREV